MRISKAVERGADSKSSVVDDLRKGKRDERSSGTLAQCWPAERPPGHLVITSVQASRHLHRAGGSDPIMAAAELFGCGCGLIVLVLGIAAAWGSR